MRLFKKQFCLPMKIGKLSLIQLYYLTLNFQHKLLTAIHKHYPLDEWLKFAKENPNVLPVSSLNRNNSDIFLISS